MIKSGKVKTKVECCPLFATDPAELPAFCPITPAWCKYQEGNSWSSVTKTGCCEDFGSQLTSCDNSKNNGNLKLVNMSVN